MEINYLTKKIVINGREHLSYIINGEHFAEVSENLGGMLEIAVCGDDFTKGYPKELEGCPAVFLKKPGFMNLEESLYFISFNPLNGREFEFNHQAAVILTSLYDELRKDIKETKNQNKKTRLKNALNQFLSLEVVTEQQFNDLFLFKHNHYWTEIYDLPEEKYKNLLEIVPENKIIGISAKANKNIYELKEKIATLKPEKEFEYPIVRDLVDEGDIVILVTPIDSAAPKSRLILPQQQTIRELLEVGTITIVIQPDKLVATLDKLVQKPKLIITDSQVFKQVAKDTPNDMLLTSFSILMARHKGNLKTQVEGAATIENLNDGDRILISEGCTHHRQCDDIGTVKLPNWIKKYTGKDLKLHFTSGTEFPTDLSEYKLIIHCGGCTLNEKEMKYRLKCANDNKIPMTNYGTLIAYMNGILERSIEVFNTNKRK